MSNAITKKNLDGCVDRLNKLVNGSEDQWANGKPKPGAFILDGAYGGWKLSRYCNDGGGETPISCGGYVSKKDLWDIMQSILTFNYEVNKK